MAVGISGTPGVSTLILTLPTNSGTTTVTYTYSSAAGTLTRAPASGTAQILHTNLLTFYFRYYDATGNPYDNASAPFTTVTDYLSSIKQVSISFSSQAGSSINGTLTQVYRGTSPRLLVRNKSWLP